MNAIHPRLVVLLADDDENDVVFIGRALEKLGLLQRLITVEDGEQVIAYFRGLDAYADRQKYPIPDLLLLDQRMPKASGLDVLFWIRAQKVFEQLPTLVLTTGLQPDQLAILRRLGGRFCVKSGSVQELVEGLNEAIRNVLQANRGTPLQSSEGCPEPLPANAGHLP